MIEKKPFRVTNEQAKKDAKRECKCHCNSCEFDKPCREIEAYASDLLDASELIDKQVSLIKEMRKILNHVRITDYDNSCDCDSCKNSDDVILATLEKSKEWE